MRVIEFVDVDPELEIYTYELGVFKPVNRDSVVVQLIRRTFYPPKFYIGSHYFYDGEWREFQPEEQIRPSLEFDGLTNIIISQRLLEGAEITDKNHKQMIEDMRTIIEMYDNQQEGSGAS